MKYDYNTLAEYRGVGNHDEYRIPPQLQGELIPNFQGAKMMFPICPEISKAMSERANIRFGYTFADPVYYQIVIDWMKRRRNWIVCEDTIVVYSGILDAFYTAIQIYTDHQDGVIVFSPNYHMHTDLILRCGRAPVHVPLLLENNQYSIDFEKLASAMQNPRNKMMCLCNPDNPTGRVWTKEELIRIAKLACKYDVLIFSDEIFAEISMSNVPVTPMTAEHCGAERTIVATSLSKVFNLVGTRHANLIIEDKKIRDAFVNMRDKMTISEMDPFMYPALQAAYTQGGEWLDETKCYIKENMEFAQKYFDTELPGVHMHKTRGIYLAWIDWRGLGKTEEELNKFLLDEAKISLDMGSPYGAECFTRFCMATPRNVLTEAFARLDHAAAVHGMKKNNR